MLKLNHYNSFFNIEVINKIDKNNKFKYAVFDFDGTISLFREGWHHIMVEYFSEELYKTPKGKVISKQRLTEIVDEFVTINTGKQTIYQCIALSEYIAKFGGKPMNPLEYKCEYHNRLMNKIQSRIDEVRNDSSQSFKYTIPGCIEFLEKLREKNLVLYLASGTDEFYVKEEAKLLKVDKYFDKIYGAQDDYKKFSKKKLINQILKNSGVSANNILGFGDGYVEIENIKSAGGYAFGLATEETNPTKINVWKRNRLIQAGADIIIPNFMNSDYIIKYIFGV